jgi:Lon protease-like protein
MSALVDDFPLFPLGLVALPTEGIPLHVFEPRYRIMFAELLRRGGAFGIVWAAEDGLRETGCACVVEQVLQRHEDGRLDVLCRATTPLQLAGSVGAAPYPVARVALLADEDEDRDDDARTAAEDAYLALVEAVGATKPETEALAGMAAYAIAATVDLPAQDKQAMLELRSERDRLVLLTQVLDRLLGGLTPPALEQAQARSNGRVRF